MRWAPRTRSYLSLSDWFWRSTGAGWLFDLSTVQADLPGQGEGEVGDGKFEVVYAQDLGAVWRWHWFTHLIWVLTSNEKLIEQLLACARSGWCRLM